MKLLLLTIILVGLCLFLLCFNIIFRKNGKFPDGEIGHNKELRKKGLMCAKAEERKMWGYDKKRYEHESCDKGECSGSCSSCV